MSRKRAPVRDFRTAGFALDDESRRELSIKFPRVELDRTFEVFADKALANGWYYADWLAAFRNYIRNGAQYGGVKYKTAHADPAFDSLIERAKDLGFRMPHAVESVGSYRTALDAFDKQSAASAVQQFDFGGSIKRVPK